MLLETIRCEGGLALHLPYHQHRLDTTLRSLGIDASYDLSALVSPPDERVYRCRFLYDADSFSIEFHPYAARTFRSLRLMHADTLEYPFKYAERSSLNTLFEQRKECDDILIVQNGLLRDTTIANIALFIGGKWFTPAQPLLEGTTRVRLIEQNILVPAELSVDDIAKADKVAVMNAMMGFVEVEHGIIF